MTTPIADQFYMPAEWHPHERCWMAWPCRAASWPFGLARARASYLTVAQAITQFEPLTLLAPPSEIEEVRWLCGPEIEIISLPYDDSWLRDTAPTFVINAQGQLAGLDWQFNAWGEQRESLADYQQDALLAQNMLDYLQLRRYPIPLIAEGGALHVDGQGSVLVTEQCLLNPNRNPNLNASDVEALLQQALGIQQVIWLGEGLEDDETAGHIDNLACFIAPGVVMALSCNDPRDSNYMILKDNLRRLHHATDAQGRHLEIIEIEQPQARDDQDGLRLTLSYINFYRANGGVIVPTFGDEADEAAIATFKQVFPDQPIVPVYALDLTYGGGGIHCITQQQPQAIAAL
ncbi:MAG: agmatine deiminase family protein [Pseudomonadota bacterium]|nr:agmatine deiminase family protein [Pseudomonadota bacterium]